MKVKDLVTNLLKQNQEAEIWIQDRDFLLDVYEVTDGKTPDGNNFVVIIPEQDEE